MRFFIFTIVTVTILTQCIKPSKEAIKEKRKYINKCLTE